MRQRSSQQQKFQQKMTLSPQMRQSIQLLGMSAKDLADYVETAVAANPFLKKLVEHKRTMVGNLPQTPIDRADSINPKDSLLSQASMIGLDKKQVEIAEHIIDEMNENGYITSDMDEVAERLSVEAQEVEQVVGAIQSLDPAGIGARDLRECLQLQLKRRSMMDTPEYMIVTSYLPELAQEDIGAIAKGLKISIKEATTAVKGVRKLNPRPASSILGKHTETVIPELIADVDAKKVRIELNKGSVPGLKLYNPYENDFDIVKDPEARKFMKENVNAAKVLMDNLKRREDTICKVADHILKAQQEPLSIRGKDLNTLTIGEVAKALDLHPSTISRAIQNKHIEINDNIVPLSELLSHGICKDNGEVESKSAVRTRIESLVKAEDPSAPLSDAAIEKLLKKDGVTIKRRTIAKYRDMLRILPSHLRRRKAVKSGKRRTN